MKRLTICIVCAVLYGCAATPKVSALKGSYQTGFYTIESHKSYDEIWDKVIDVFARTGIPIATVEKASGLIVSNSFNFSSYTFERKGIPQDSTKWIVLADLASPYGSNPVTSVTGNFNVHIKKKGENVIMEITLTNLSAFGYGSVGFPASPSLVKIPCASTGVFEKSIAEVVK